MKHDGILLIALALAALVPATSRAQVASEKARQDRLGALDKAFDAKRNDTVSILGKSGDPFYNVPPSGGDSGSGSASSATGDKKVDLNTPKAILGRIAEKLRPTGLIDSGASRFVVAADGSLFSIGKSYTVELENRTYDVRVTRADNNTYTLEYSGETLTTPYDNNTEVEGKATFSSK
jgi:hypothetical protein